MSKQKEQNPGMAHDTIHLLLVSADTGFAASFLHSMQPYSEFPSTHAATAAEAHNLLSGAAREDPFPHPFLILLDLDAPHQESMRFLETLRKDPSLQASIVFALCHSCNSEAATQAFAIGVNLCLEKRIITTAFARFIALLSAARSQEFPPDRR